jgi:hypothetical protein
MASPATRLCCAGVALALGLALAGDSALAQAPEREERVPEPALPLRGSLGAAQPAAPADNEAASSALASSDRNDEAPRAPRPDSARLPDASADPDALRREELDARLDRAIAEFTFEPGRRLLDLRRSALPVDDAYAPLGVRAGAFTFFPELGIGGIYSDNILASASNPRADRAVELNPRLRFQSGWSRHALSGDVQATRSWYREFETEDEDSYDAILRGRIDVLRSTNVELEAQSSRFQESRGSIDFPDAAAEPGDIDTQRLAGALNHTFNRLTGTVRGAVYEIDYSDAETASGADIDSDDRDYRQNELGLRLAYEFNPAMTAFADAETNTRRFRRAAGEDGLRRDSDGWEAQAGLRFDLATIFSGEVALGYAVQNPKDAAFAEVDGLILNANLFWRPTALTTFRLEARSAIEPTTTVDSAGALTRAWLVGVDHALRRNLILGAFAAFAESEYAGIDLTEERRTGGLTLEYRLSRSVAIEADWQHTHYDAGGFDSAYRENLVRIGMRLRR